mmetsp:Transcript_133812/g.286213  ORF Transcript_133812/g.286213 Transcript_133812/m.286213 type:complete len:374 (-) Transcript_133812:228-1349(-)
MEGVARQCQQECPRALLLCNIEDRTLLDVDGLQVALGVEEFVADALVAAGGSEHERSATSWVAHVHTEARLEEFLDMSDIPFKRSHAKRIQRRPLEGDALRAEQRSDIGMVKHDPSRHSPEVPMRPAPLSRLIPFEEFDDSVLQLTPNRLCGNGWTMPHGNPLGHHLVESTLTSNFCFEVVYLETLLCADCAAWSISPSAIEGLDDELLIFLVLIHVIHWRWILRDVHFQSDGHLAEIHWEESLLSDALILSLVVEDAEDLHPLRRLAVDRNLPSANPLVEHGWTESPLLRHAVHLLHGHRLATVESAPAHQLQSGILARVTELRGPASWDAPGAGAEHAIVQLINITKERLLPRQRGLPLGVRLTLPLVFEH